MPLQLVKKTARSTKETKEPRSIIGSPTAAEHPIKTVDTFRFKSQFEDHPKSNKKSHSKVTLTNGKVNTKKNLIIRTKLNNPPLSLKEIAKKYSASHGYARRVWSEYCQKKVTSKGIPSDTLSPVLPFRVHGCVFGQELPDCFYESCPVVVSANRNGQKAYSCPSFSFVIWKSGKLRVYPHGVGWREALRRWLFSWMDPDWVGLLIDDLYVVSGRHFCASAPGVLTGFRLRIKGLGTFTSDRTPFREGTIEYEVDPGFVGRLERLERSQVEICRLLQVVVLWLKNCELDRRVKRVC